MIDSIINGGYSTFQHLKNNYRSLSYKNFINDKMTGRVIIVWCLFEKKLKFKSQDPKKHNF